MNCPNCAENVSVFSTFFKKISKCRKCEAELKTAFNNKKLVILGILAFVLSSFLIKPLLTAFNISTVGVTPLLVAIVLILSLELKKEFT